MVVAVNDREDEKKKPAKRNDKYIYQWDIRIFVGCPVSQDPGRKVTVVMGMGGGRDKAPGSSLNNI